jgi:hypothetical protein
MSKRAHDIFALVINFLGTDWQPKYVTIKRFETNETTRQTFAKNLTELFDTYGLEKKN